MKPSDIQHTVILSYSKTYHACDEGQGTGVILDRLEIVTFRQVSVEGDISGNVFSGVHGVACLAHTVDGGLVLRKSYKGLVNVYELFNNRKLYLVF